MELSKLISYMSHILYHSFICNNRKIKVAFGKMNDINNNELIFIGILTFYREFYILHNTRNRIGHDGKIQVSNGINSMIF